jgi:4-amino-4-deoxy-L-arabinose transferase-like glycosyltransferase
MKIFMKYLNSLGIVLIVILAAVLLTYKINKPFIGHHDWNGVFWGNIARNYLSYTDLYLGRITDRTLIDSANPEGLIFFSHYTPLLPVLFTFSVFFLGVSEAGLRIPVVVLSLLMLFFIFRIGERLYSKRVGIFSAIFCMSTPMFLYYGKLPDHEPVLVPLCVMSFYFYLILKDKYDRNYLFFFSLLLIALLESWGSFFLLFFILIHAVFFRKMKKPFIITLIVMALSVVAFHFGSIILNNGTGNFLGFLKYGLWRMNMDSSEANIIRFGWKQFFSTEARFGIVFYTRILIGLSGLWTVRFFLLFRKNKNSSDFFLIILFLFGIFFILVFRNLAYIHDYKLYLLLPFIVLSSARMGEIIFSGILKLLKPKISAKNIYYLTYLIFLITSFGVFFERRPFLDTLLNSSFNKPGMDLGNIIKSGSLKNEKTLVSSMEFDSFYGVFTHYYANRNIVAEDLKYDYFINNQNLYEKFKFIVFVEGRPRDEKLKSYLMQKYVVKKSGEFLIIDLKSPNKFK